MCDPAQAQAQAQAQARKPPWLQLDGPRLTRARPWWRVKTHHEWTRRPFVWVLQVRAYITTSRTHAQEQRREATTSIPIATRKNCIAPSAAFLERIERRVGRSSAGMASSGSSSSTASSGSSTSAASRASREGALGAPASVSRMARASSSTSSSGTRIHPELWAEARPFYPATGPSSSMTVAPAASETFSVMAKPFYPTTDSSSSMSTMPPALRCRVDLPPPWTPASSFFTPHSSDPSAAAVWATNPGEATNPDSPPEDPELSAAELESLGFVEVKEDGMGSEVPIKDQSQQFPGAGQDDQLGKGKQSVVGQGDQLGNGKQPLGLEQDKVRMPLVSKKIPLAPEEIYHTIPFGSYRPPLPKEHQKEGMQQLLAQCNPEVEHMRSEQNPQVGAGSRADRQ